MSERREERLDFDVEEVRQAYRALPDQPVPESLDARVLQAAAAALAERRVPKWMRWSAPIALAASVLVVVAIVLDPGAREPLRARRPAPKEVSVESKAVAPTEAPAAAPPSVQLEMPAPRSLSLPPVGETKSNDVLVAGRRTEIRVQDVPLSIAVLPQPAQPSIDVDEATAAAPREEALAEQAKAERQAGALDLARMQRQVRPTSPPPPVPTSEPEARAGKRSAASVQEIIVTARERQQAQPVGPRAPQTAARSAPREADSGTLQKSTGGQPDERAAAWLRKIHDLQSHGHTRHAAREIEKLRKAYPDLDIDAELRRLSSED